MSLLTIRICDPWASYISWLEDESDRMKREHELDEDIRTEQALAVAYAYGVSDVPWPWYADAPIEVQEPEIIVGRPVRK